MKLFDDDGIPSGTNRLNPGLSILAEGYKYFISLKIRFIPFPEQDIAAAWRENH